MPQNVTLASCVLIEFGRSQKGAYAKLQCSLTKSLIKSLAWGDFADYEKKVTLKGDLAATSLELTPSDEALKRHRVQVKIQRVNNFVATQQEIEGSRGKGTRWLVTCDVEISDENGCRLLESYMHAVPKAEAKISYEKQPEQADIPGTEIKSEELPLQ
jgi:hypothetical protein